MVLKRIALVLVFILLGSLLSPYEIKADGDQEIFKRLLNGERILKQREFVKEKEKTVYLTFDDGPSQVTSKILDILDQENIKATFFVLGENATNHPNILERIIDEGHSIGNHTYSHQYVNLYSSFSNYFEEIQRTEQIIFDITGKRTSLTRAPGGTYLKWDSFYFYYMDQADYIVYDWNVDSGDSKRKAVDTKEIIKTIKNSRLADKLIVLMHDSEGHDSTLKALPAIIQYYRSLGYQFKPITEMVEPIIQPIGLQRWKRKNEYAIKNSFVRVTTSKEIVQIDNYRDKFNEDALREKISSLFNKNTEIAKNIEDHRKREKKNRTLVIKYGFDYRRLLGLSINWLVQNTMKTFFTFSGTLIYNIF